ncbi:MAG: thymidine phosphorylase, partial [Bacillota bacterium]
MRTYDLILKKRNGAALSGPEIKYLIDGYVSGTVADYQAAALAMAIYFQGMSEEELFYLTDAMVASGDSLSFDSISAALVDKHSTGGVGDKTTLVLLPMVAAAGVPVAKLSGRGLGHTGGTLDKLESIPGFRVNLSGSELMSAVKEIGLVITGQTTNLVPADKKLYALRDVTATVDSLSLIAASIMSKKLASGAKYLVIDVKVGNGAFLKELEDAYELARLMIAIGSRAGCETAAVITGMDQPLGFAVGNALEVKEALVTLQGSGPSDLKELCLELGGRMLYMAGKVYDPKQGGVVLEKAISSGRALDKFRKMVINQGGDIRAIDNPDLLPRAEKLYPVKAAGFGYVSRLDAGSIGAAAVSLGAGRAARGNDIDHGVGVILEKKTGD